MPWTAALPELASALASATIALMVARLRRGRHAGAATKAGANPEAEEAHAWLRLAASAVPLGHWRLHVRARALEWSDQIFHIHGLDLTEYSPALESALAMFHPEDQNSVSAALEAGTNFELKARLRRPDTELRHVILRGEVQGEFLLGIMVDVTEQKQAEARLREANQVALHANAALKEMTLEDQLTGLANRRQFDLSLVHEFKRALRSGLPLGLVLVDLDHFQSYNEIYGEAAGDACLRRVAEAIKSVPRRTGDLVVRYAGEEIAVLLPLADDFGAARVAGTIHEAVRALKLPHVGSESSYVSVSCGAAAFTGLQDMNNPLELVRRADQALYRAKTDGRDRVVRFEMALNSEVESPYAKPVVAEMGRLIKSRG